MRVKSVLSLVNKPIILPRGLCQEPPSVKFIPRSHWIDPAAGATAGTPPMR